MDVEAVMREVMKEIEESLIFNQSMLPALSKANDAGMTLTIGPAGKTHPGLIQITIRRVGVREIHNVSMLIDPAGLLSQTNRKLAGPGWVKKDGKDAGTDVPRDGWKPVKKDDKK